MCFGNLRPLLNSEILKKRIGVKFENIYLTLFQTRLTIFKIVWTYCIISNYFEKRVCFQTQFEKIPPVPPSAAPSGRRRARRRGYFFKLSLKTDHFFKIVWKCTPFWNFSNEFGKMTIICFQTWPISVFSKFHHFARNARPYLSWSLNALGNRNSHISLEKWCYF